jgi:hypothetical protein
MHAACPANLIFIDSVILQLGEEYKLWSPSLYKYGFLQPPATSS